MSTSATPAGASLKGILDSRSRSRRRTRRIAKVLMLVALPAVGVCAPLYGIWVGLAAAAALLMLSLVVLGSTTVPDRLLAGLGAVAALAALLVLSSTAVWPVGGVAVVTASVLVLLAALLPFLFPAYTASRGVTSLYAQAAALVAAGLLPAMGVIAYPLGIVAICLIVLTRGGGLVMLRMWRARLRSHVRVQPRAKVGVEPIVYSMDLENVQAGYDMEVRMGALLLQLDPTRWHTLFSRALPGTRADVDCLLIGLPGVFTIDAKDRKGSIVEQLVMPDEEYVIDDLTGEGEWVHPEPYTQLLLNGNAEWMEELLKPVAFEARKVMATLCLSSRDMHPVVCFSEAMTLEADRMSVVYDGVPIELVTLDGLLELIEQAPQREWRRPGRLPKDASSEQLAQAAVTANADYLEDLAAVADYMFPPKR